MLVCRMIHIALLRAVNVGGRSLRMAELAAMLRRIGFGSVRTLLQSGNVVLDSGAKRGAALEALLEAETEKRLGIRADYLVRTPAEWREAIAANPFAREAARDPAHLVLVPLKAAPQETRMAALRAAIQGRERANAVGRSLYLVYPDGIGRSKLTLGVVEKALATRGTARNWNTVLRLAALVE
jgi:uncharacterized protein (DUF1697 family)